MLKFDVVMLNLQKNVVTFHEKLRKDLIDSADRHCLSKDMIEVFRSIYPPVFLKKDNEYKMVARHWVYCLNVNEVQFSFPALIFQDEDMIPAILEAEDIECSLFQKKATPAENAALTATPSPGVFRSPSKATKARHKAINSGRICPLCNGPLLKSRKIEGLRDGAHKISCHNKSKGCDFFAILNDYEFTKFCKYQSRTDQWLRRIPDGKCPKCTSDLYERLVQLTETHQQRYEKCRYNHQSSKRHCEYFKLLKEIKS